MIHEPEMFLHESPSDIACAHRLRSGLQVGSRTGAVTEVRQYVSATPRICSFLWDYWQLASVPLTSPKYRYFLRARFGSIKDTEEYMNPRMIQATRLHSLPLSVISHIVS